MQGINKKLLPLGVLAAFIMAAWLISQSAPSSHRHSKPRAAGITVETMPVTQQDYQITINSFGIVQPQTQIQLVSQVSGQIVTVSQHFREGGFFNQGDLLITLDPRDYDIAIETAEAELASSEASLAEEQARAKQARLEWSGRNLERASDFALRIPQVAAAKANTASARAKLRQAQLNRERTEIKAPFAGRILKKSVDIGQVVATSTTLAEIYATNIAEVRLPIKNSELNYIDLPEYYGPLPSQSYPESPEQESALPQISGSSVVIESRLGGEAHRWHARLVRTSGAIDSESHQLHTIAQIDNPYRVTDLSTHRLPLKIGQYVTATIRGRKIKDAIIVPSKSIYQGSYVYLVKKHLPAEQSQKDLNTGASPLTKENNLILERRSITVAWQNSHDALITSGLHTGDQLITTPLGQVSSGTSVHIAQSVTHNTEDTSP